MGALVSQAHACIMLRRGSGQWAAALMLLAVAAVFLCDYIPQTVGEETTLEAYYAAPQPVAYSQAPPMVAQMQPSPVVQMPSAAPQYMVPAAPPAYAAPQQGYQQSAPVQMMQAPQQLAQRTLRSPKLQAQAATKVAAATEHMESVAETHHGPADPAKAHQKASVGHHMREHARDKLYNDDEAALKSMKQQITHLRKQTTHKAASRRKSLLKYAEGGKSKKKQLLEEETRGQHKHLWSNRAVKVMKRLETTEGGGMKTRKRKKNRSYTKHDVLARKVSQRGRDRILAEMKKVMPVPLYLKYKADKKAKKKAKEMKKKQKATVLLAAMKKKKATRKAKKVQHKAARKAKRARIAAAQTAVKNARAALNKVIQSQPKEEGLSRYWKTQRL